MNNHEKVKRIKAYIKKNQPKVKMEHFNWSQFKNTLKLVYDKKTDTYIIKELNNNE